MTILLKIIYCQVKYLENIGGRIAKELVQRVFKKLITSHLRIRCVMLGNDFKIQKLYIVFLFIFFHYDYYCSRRCLIALSQSRWKWSWIINCSLAEIGQFKIPKGEISKYFLSVLLYTCNNCSLCIFFCYWVYNYIDI